MTCGTCLVYDTINKKIKEGEKRTVGTSLPACTMSYVIFIKILLSQLTTKRMTQPSLLLFAACSASANIKIARRHAAGAGFGFSSQMM